MITIAFNNPLPRTSFTILESASFSPNSFLKIFPSSRAFLASSSSTTTSSAAFATVHANGFPPKVEPCSPGLIHIIISSSAKTADIGRTPPDNAFPSIRISGLASS